MNKMKFLTISTVLLLVLNVVLITMLIVCKPKGRNPDALKNLAIEKLQLDAPQVEAYEKLIGAHRQAIKAKQDSLRDLKETLYKTLSNDADSTKTNALILEIGAVQEDIEHVHYEHFSQVRQLCKESQLEAFNQLTADIAKHLATSHPPKRR